MMTYKEFIKKNNYRILLDECDDINNSFQLVFTNDSDIFYFYELRLIDRFCKNNKLMYEIGNFYGKLVCHIFNVVEDDI